MTIQLLLKKAAISIWIIACSETCERVQLITTSRVIISFMIINGGNVVTLCKLLGHSN